MPLSFFHALSRLFHAGLLLIAAATAVAAPAAAQPADAPDADRDTLVLTLDAALDVALRANHDLRRVRLDVRNAEAQVREAWGQVFPQVDGSASYTRNVLTANPFAGSDISSFFGGGGTSDWVAYNEQARTDDDPATQPITLAAFQDSVRTAQEAAGITLSTSSNPFGVDNQFNSGIQVTQTLFNGSAFAAIAGAKELRDVNQRAVDRQEQLLVDQVRQAFYQALLSRERVRVTAESVARTRQTLREVDQQVERGVVPKFQRLSTEVELSNLETQLVEVRTQADLALDDLKLATGLPVDRPLRVDGALTTDALYRYRDLNVSLAIEQALRQRADLKQLQNVIALRETDKRITQAEYLPSISAFANFNYVGRVPDNRTRTVTDPSDPFFYDQVEREFFDSEFWNPSISVGVQLSWNIFNGFQTTARVQQRQVAVNQARVDYEQLQQQVRLQVQSALKNLEAARQRIVSQERNVERAETNYEFVSARVGEGVSTQLELREASDQLDQSRLNYLQAVFDFLDAQSALETALGTLPSSASATP